MIALAVLIPGLVIGGIAWVAVGVLRQRGRERFTLTTAVAFYAELMLIAGMLATLAGVSVLFKLLLSTLNPAYAYWQAQAPAGYGGPTAVQQQQQDLIMAAMLVGIGLVVAFGHWFLRRIVAALPDGSPSWVAGGALVAVTALSGLAGFLGAIVGGYQTLVYFIVAGPGASPFADAAGAALTFVPAWAVSMTLLLRRARHAPAFPTGHPAAG